jgi:hypothetical protein
MYLSVKRKLPVPKQKKKILAQKAKKKKKKNYNLTDVNQMSNLNRVWIIA